jgi:hypothetical protein
VLSVADKQRYSRQILLPELGLGGQERLCAARGVLEPSADPRSARVARDYLERAGVAVEASSDAELPSWPVAASDQVVRVAGDPLLEDSAAWLLGAWAAVEVIKRLSGAGTPAEPPRSLVLAAEQV